MKSDDLEENLRKQLKTEFKRHGIDIKDINFNDISVKQYRGNIKIKYKDFEATFPSPSSEAIDSWWKTYSPFITWGLLVLLSTSATIVLMNVFGNIKLRALAT